MKEIFVFSTVIKFILIKLNVFVYIFSVIPTTPVQAVGRRGCIKES